MYLSVVIPAYNEENRILSTLERTEEYLSKQNFDYEVLVVDDGSKDKTVEIVNKFSETHQSTKLLKNPQNMGKGEAVKNGVLHSNGDIVLFSDADLSTPIEEIQRLFKWLNQDYDIAIGSRNVFDPEIKVDTVLKRRLVGRVFNAVVQFFTIKEFKDTQCGFKAFKKDVAKELFSRQQFKGFSFDVEILYLAVKMNYKIKEVAVNWTHCDSSKVSIIKDSIRMFSDIIKIKKLHKDIKPIN